MKPMRFMHPGTFMSPEMTRTLSKDASSHPLRKKALEKLMKDTPLGYSAQALANVDVGYHGVGQGHKECTKDGEVAVSAALLLWATGNEKYGMLAIDILRDWATTNVVWKGDNALLEAAWSICSMARAAELLKHSMVPAVRDAWAKKVEGVFFSWLDKVIMPVLCSEHIWKWDMCGNWHFSQISARMQLAILREDKGEWEWCVKKYPEALQKALTWKCCPGETAETLRDVTHAQFLLGGAVQIPEMAHHQGFNLWDERLLDCFELQARIMMKEVPAGVPKESINTPYGYWYEPVWHIPYAHFVGRKKKSMPHTKRYIDSLGPDRVCFHWGPNLLTHFDRCHA